ncbi:MAG: TonB family protein, partial [Deltaproteobacteria bacterium]|nr:TonB family protein [Deltaproteobacteria bacterium]
MDSNSQVPSPLEVILERMRKRDGTPLGRFQRLSHQWLTWLENHRFIQRYGSLFRRSRDSISLKSDSTINVDSIIPFSLILHLLFILLLSWTAIASISLPKPGPIRVQFVDMGMRPKRQPKQETKASAPKAIPEPKKAAPPKPAPKPKNVPPPLPAPKVLAKAPRVAPVAVTADPADDLVQLPMSQTSAFQPSQLKVETQPGATVSAVSAEELQLLKSAVQGIGLPAAQGNPSAIQSPDFAPYLEMIKQRVEAVWDYPAGVSGKHEINLVFVIDRGGKLVRAKVLDATNSKLDRGVLQAVRAASPFPPIPESLKDLAG